MLLLFLEFDNILEFLIQHYSFFLFTNSNCFCNRAVFAFATLIYLNVFFSFRKKRSRFFRTRRYLNAEKNRSQSRFKRTHFTQLSKLSFTQHYFYNRAQLWHERIISFLEFTKFKCCFRRLEEFLELIARWQDMKKNKISFRDENLKKESSVNFR